MPKREPALSPREKDLVMNELARLMLVMAKLVYGQPVCHHVQAFTQFAFMAMASIEDDEVPHFAVPLDSGTATSLARLRFVASGRELKAQQGHGVGVQ